MVIVSEADLIEDEMDIFYSTVEDELKENNERIKKLDKITGVIGMSEEWMNNPDIDLTNEQIAVSAYKDIRRILRQ